MKSDNSVLRNTSLTGEPTGRQSDFSKKDAAALSLFHNARQALLFDAKYPLTSKNSPPILRSIESNTLSNKGSFTARDMVKREVLDKVVIANRTLC